MTRALAIAVVLAWAPLAVAQSGGERVRQLVEEGEFERAAAAFAEAMRASVLSREELIGLLEARALLAHAQRDDAALDEALSGLASIVPTHRFDASFPPDLAVRSVEVGRRMRGRLSVEVQIVPSGTGVRLGPRVEHDPGALVRAVRIRVLDPTTGAWTVAEGPVEAAAGRRVHAYVEAIGPGGVVLARRGSPEDPIVLEGPGAGTGAPNDPAPASPPVRAGPPDWAWVLVGVGVVLLVAAGIGAGVYAATNPDIDTQPRPPMIVIDD